MLFFKKDLDNDYYNTKNILLQPVTQVPDTSVPPLLSCSNKAHALYTKKTLLLDTFTPKNTSVQICKLVDEKV